MGDEGDEGAGLQRCQQLGRPSSLRGDGGLGAVTSKSDAVLSLWS